MVAALVTYGNRKQLQLKKKKCVFPCFFVWTCLVRRCDCMRIPIGINRTAHANTVASITGVYTPPLCVVGFRTPHMVQHNTYCNTLRDSLGGTNRILEQFIGFLNGQHSPENHTLAKLCTLSLTLRSTMVLSERASANASNSS